MRLQFRTSASFQRYAAWTRLGRRRTQGGREVATKQGSLYFATRALTSPHRPRPWRVYLDSPNYPLSCAADYFGSLGVERRATQNHEGNRHNYGHAPGYAQPE